MQAEQLDEAYLKLPRQLSELNHAYGPSVHILADPYLLTRLAVLCQESTHQPAINTTISDLYGHMIATVVAQEFPLVVKQYRTRMAETSPFGTWTGEVIETATKAVTVDILRAGCLPSQVCFDFLNKTLEPGLVRQDHVVMSRQTDAEGHVVGAHLGASKIGGDVDNAIVLFPDPMGATGGSLCEVIHHYKTQVSGQAKKYIAIHLIVTPEYIRHIKIEHPDVIVYALRLDRGASPADVLKTTPGSNWPRETGLTDKQYIVPGGGGFGEIMNNSYC